jgi:hypothetical protein
MYTWSVCTKDCNIPFKFGVLLGDGGSIKPKNVGQNQIFYLVKP